MNIRSSRSGNDEISSSIRQFLFDYKVVKSALDNYMVSGSEFLIDFIIKRGVRKLPQSFFLQGSARQTTKAPPLSAALKTMSLRLLRFSSAALSSEDWKKFINEKI